MKWFVFFLLLASLVSDVYIYRSVICYYFRRLPVRIAYIIFAVLSNGAAVAAIAFFTFPDSDSSAGIVAVMWLVWAFFLVGVPKLLFAAGGVFDFATKLIVRRRVPVFRALSLVLSLAVIIVMICGATTGRNKFRVTEIEVSSERIPAGFDGYRIVQISDLHTGTMTNPEKQIARLAEKIAALQPDMVVSTGDLVNMRHSELTPEIMAELAATTAPDGVYSVWGNHDLGFYMRGADSAAVFSNHDSLAAKVASIGWRTLSDSSVYIRRGGDSILLSGIDYPTTKLNGHNNILGGADIDTAYRGIEGDPYNIVLEHSPLMWREITGRGRGDLVLSGHTHAMQLKFHLPGRTWSPAGWMYPEWSGKYKGNGEKNSVLYVNDGIGCVGYPMRIGTRPEITVFTLNAHAQTLCE